MITRKRISSGQKDKREVGGNKMYKKIDIYDMIKKDRFNIRRNQLCSWIR